MHVRVFGCVTKHYNFYYNEKLLPIKSMKIHFSVMNQSFATTLRVQAHIVIRKKFIFSYNDLVIQIHIFFLVIICLNYLIIYIL